MAGGTANDKENIEPGGGFREYIRPTGSTSSTTAPVQVQIQQQQLDSSHSSSLSSSSSSSSSQHLMAISPPNHVMPSALDIMDPLDGNHSSEEELEEINKFEAGASAPLAAEALSSPSPLLPAPPALINTTPVAVDTPMELQPVQFSTSPPTGVHVHKPRRSSSPPAKMFVFENGDSELNNGFHIPAAGAGALAAGNGGAVSGRQQFSGDAKAERSAERRERRRTISPRKRYRQSRTQHIQRPCLDFEKMQQVGLSLIHI